MTIRTLIAYALIAFMVAVGIALIVHWRRERKRRRRYRR